MLQPHILATPLVLHGLTGAAFYLVSAGPIRSNVQLLHSNPATLSLPFDLPATPTFYQTCPTFRQPPPTFLSVPQDAINVRLLDVTPFGWQRGTYPDCTIAR